LTWFRNVQWLMSTRANRRSFAIPLRCADCRLPNPRPSLVGCAVLDHERRDSWCELGVGVPWLVGRVDVLRRPRR
jgi:hypothetical protein